jgi:hypothetical protein
MSKPAITQEKWEEIGGNNDFDAAEGLFAAFDSQSVVACGETRWGPDYGHRGFMHSTDHRSALIKIFGHEPTWLAVYDSWVAGDAIPTQAFLMEPDDGSLSYCLIRFYNSMGRGLREWNSVLSTGKLSNKKPVMGECADRVEPHDHEPHDKPARIKLSALSHETLKMLPMKGQTIGPGRASRLQKLRDEIEPQLGPPPAHVTLSALSKETVGMLPMKGQTIGPGRGARLQKLREEIEAQLEP